MRTHPRDLVRPAPTLDIEHALDTLRFTEKTLDKAADLSFEPDVRRRILRAAERIRSAIENLERPSLVEVRIDPVVPRPTRDVTEKERVALGSR